MSKVPTFAPLREGGKGTLGSGTYAPVTDGTEKKRKKHFLFLENFSTFAIPKG
jgi:hypothetical protein